MIREVRLIDLPKIEDYRGNLGFFENNNQIPFNIRRTYWVYDVPVGESLGGYAYKGAHEFIIAISGSFDIHVSDGNKEKKYNLNDPSRGLYTPNFIWKQIKNFSKNSLMLVVSDVVFDKNDYMQSFDEFKSLVNEKK